MAHGPDLAARIDALMPQAREELAELVALRSVADPRQFPPQECERAAQWVLDRFAAVGFDDAHMVETADGSMAVVGSRPCGNPHAPTVLLYAHYDVQPAVPLELWTDPPYEPTIRDGRLYARGATDNKGEFLPDALAIVDDVFRRMQGHQHKKTSRLRALRAWD